MATYCVTFIDADGNPRVIDVDGAESFTSAYEAAESHVLHTHFDPWPKERLAACLEVIISVVA